ncbi:MAG: hypothetical protein EXQ96_05345 [Alphaproteobacteria bacterium]|nr:hypothetical protein [Alphaproteobacteria bacterium]
MVMPETGPGFRCLDVAEAPFDIAAVGAALAADGVVLLRNLFAQATVAEVVRRAEEWLALPAVAGVPGYAKVDAPKRLLNPCLLGGPALDLLADERVIDAIEAHMGSECVLAETTLKRDAGVGYVYFPLHSDFAVGWAKSADATDRLTLAQLREPVGVGGVIYLHDTTEGGFCYCIGSHKLLSPHGQDLTRYPAAERAAIEATLVRLDGRAGDLVLFDDRGFHGPDQPSRVERTVILLDYYRVATFGRVQVSPLPLWSTDLARLTPRQLAVLGVGADFWVSPMAYTATRFRRSAAYGLTRLIIENSYLLNHAKAKLKALIGR